MDAPAELYVFPLSFAQQRLWFLERLVEGSSSYNLDLAVRMEGPLDVSALERSLQEIVRRHEVLRTTFTEIDGQPVQVVSADLSLSLRRVACTSRDRGSAEAEARRLAMAAAREPFDLARGPLVRATLVRLAPDASVLLLALHHIVTDGWSMGILFQELTTLYAAFAAGRPSPLAPLPVQYADFAIWQRDWLTGDALEAQIAFWRAQLADLPTLELPSDRTRPAVKTFRGASLATYLSASLTTRLKQLSQREGVTLFMTMLAGFGALLGRYSGQTTIAVGSPIANRTRVELESLIGFFANTLVLRIDLDGQPSFRTLLGRVRDRALGAYAHQDLPFERLVEAVQPQRDLSRNPLFEVMFQLQTVSKSDALRLEGVEISSLDRQNDTAKFDLSLGIWDLGDRLAAQFEYSTDLFDEATIARMAEHLVTLLDAASDAPDRPVAELPILTPAERQCLLRDWNATDADTPIACTHVRVAQQAARAPAAVAVRAGSGQLTYDDLDRQANRLAHLLRARGVAAGHVVAVRLPRSLDLVVTLLAELKAGAAYFPLDPATPPARAEATHADADIALLVTNRPLLGTPVCPDDLVCDLDAEAMHLAAMPDTDPCVPVRPDDLAYVIYTSGSSGAPKGVEIPHRGLANLVAWHVATYDVTEHDRAAQTSSVGFDAAGWEIWPYLAAGASVHLVDDADRSSPTQLLDMFAAHAITISFVATPVAEAIVAASLPPGLVLRALLTGGDRLLQRPDRPLPFALVNHYGPTENTVVSTSAIVHSSEPGASSVAPPPIGRPIANTTAYILDGDGQPVPIGVPGELYVGGRGLAKGYRCRPDLTAERFVERAAVPEAGRLYRTGDRARFRPDGQIEFLGRLDDQIKLHGFRIEPAEIEMALLTHPAVHDAWVIRREDAASHPRLVAYLVAATVAGAGQRPAADALTHFLQAWLPDYMIPAAYVWLPAIPLTAHGKRDARALPPPGHERPDLDTRYHAPVDRLERQIAGIWRDVLRLDEVGRHDNFFDLGGRSLLLVRVHARLREATGHDLSILDLFRYPTVAALSAHVGRLPRHVAAIPVAHQAVASTEEPTR
jgi:amino acid adenylation domain-containing protein